MCMANCRLMCLMLFISGYSWNGEVLDVGVKFSAFGCLLLIPWGGNYVTLGSVPIRVTIPGSKSILVIMYKISWPICIRRAFAFSSCHGLFCPCWHKISTSLILWRSMETCWPGTWGPPGKLCKICVRLGRLGTVGVYQSFIKTCVTGTQEALALLRTLFMVQVSPSMKPLY